MRWLSLPGLLLMLGMLLGCYPKGDPSRPVPVSLLPAPQPAKRLVVVLPGRGDDLEALRKSGIAETIQRAWPDADVVLSGLALGYYLQGNAVPRLHDEIIVPARARGYREVWLLGASMGGMGALLYDRAHPGDVDGLILLAPYMGEKPLLKRIADAGGVARWDPGPVPEAIDAGNVQRELWRHVRDLARDPARSRRAWLAYGESDRLRQADALLASALPPDHVLLRPGGHAWSVWTPAAGELLRSIDATHPR